jgi:hypothetical protein
MEESSRPHRRLDGLAGSRSAGRGQNDRTASGTRMSHHRLSIAEIVKPVYVGVAQPRTLRPLAPGSVKVVQPPNKPLQQTGAASWSFVEQYPASGPRC